MHMRVAVNEENQTTHGIPEDSAIDSINSNGTKATDQKDLEGFQDRSTHRFECIGCGYVYDPIEGVKKLGILSGTTFDELDPLVFRCPVCRARTEAFRDIGPRDKPSGFEENFNYGFGVNRLTPGQKNVLIFGGLAFAVACFLSLYSLH